MAFGSFDKDSEFRTMSEINVTPLVDVMLVLLVIFMLMTPLMITHNLPVELPKTEAGAMQVKPEIVTIMVNARNELFWNNTQIAQDALKLKLSESAQRKPQPEVRMIADQTVQYGLIAGIIGEIKAVGLWQLNFVTLTPEDEKNQKK